MSSEAAARGTPGGVGGALSRHTHIGYALGSVGTGAFATVPGLLLAYYLTDTLGVAAGLAALVVAVPKLWDVIALPVVGRLSDRAADRSGSRRPFLLAGGLLLPVAFVALFAAPPSWSPEASAVWVLIAFVLAATAFAVFQVPYIAMPAEITDSPTERTTLMSWRVAFLAVAILLAGAGAPAVRDAVGETPAGYLAMAVAVAALIALGMLGCWWMLRGVEPVRTVQSEARLRDALRVALADRAFTRLLAVFILQALATSAMLAAGQYFATYVLDDSKAITPLFVCLVAPAVLVMPLWMRVARARGKAFGYTAATLLFLAGALGLVASRALPVAAIYLLVALCGIGYAGMQMFPLSLLPDVIADDAERTGANRAGVFTGVWTAGETAGFALGPAVVLAVLAIGGFVSSQPDEKVTQPDSAQLAVLLAFSVVPALLILVSLPLLRRIGRASDLRTRE